MALTESWLKAQYGKSKTKELVKADRDGLCARVSPKGKVTYTLRYYYNGSRKRIDLGSYPLMSLKEARGEALRLRKKLEEGHDPKIVRQLEKQAIIAAESLTGLFDLWYDSYCIKNKKGHHEIKRSFELHVFPKLGSLPAERITLHAWLDLLEPIANKRPAIAERLLVNTKQLYKFAVKRKLVSANPLADIFAKEDLQIQKRSVDRCLSDEEIKMLWLALDHSRITPKNKLFVKLCLIYGCRNGELRQAEKSHFDFNKGVWTIPPENHKLGKKSGKPLLRPITPTIKGYLKQAFELSAESAYVFTNDGSSEVMGVRAPLAIPYNVMQYLRRHEGYEMEHWSMHVLRKSARTRFSEITQFHIAEVMLGHAIGSSVARVYDHYDYLKEQAEAYEKWCRKLHEMVGEELPEPSNDNVVEIRKRRTA
jgi:integrase